MSEPNDPPSSSFPESSLTPSEPPPMPEPSQPHGDPVHPDAPPPQEPDPMPVQDEPSRPHGDPVAPPPPLPVQDEPPPSTGWMQPSEPAAGPAWETPVAPPPAFPPAGGMVGGDPLAGSGAGAPSTFPPGYTSPPPPGAGGDYGPPPSSPAFGSGATAAGTYVLAGWWRRVGAALIDGLIIGVIALIIMAPLGVGLFATDSSNDEGIVALIVGFVVGMLVVMAVVFAYAPIMMGKTNGKTVGRMVTGIRVVRAGGEPMTIGFAALREVAVKTLLIGTVAGSFTFGLASLLDVLWPLWDDENRALHDFVVNTRTVMDPA